MVFKGIVLGILFVCKVTYPYRLIVRNPRGVAQFNGKALVSILEQGTGSKINHAEAQVFLKQLIDR